MAPSKLFSGTLQPKKKGELQEIAVALRLSDRGTREDLQDRIKIHLDRHQATLEEEPAFAGLFGRRKRSVQPQPPPSRVPESSDEKNSAPVRIAPATRRVTALEPIRESTPAIDAQEVSTILKSNPFSPNVNSPFHVGQTGSQLGSPTGPPPLPPSPTRSVLSIVPRPNVDAIVGVVKKQEEVVLRSTSDLVVSVRSFLSNSRNIWSLTAVLELLYILYIIIPWRTVELSLSSVASSSASTVYLVYPPWSVFQTSIFWSIIGHWSIPSLFIPALFGTLISFRPTTSARSSALSIPLIPFDPLTASIIRLAAQIAYPLATVNAGVDQVDVIGFRWRVLNAAVGVAFAFAEAIAAAPVLSLKTSTPARKNLKQKLLTEDESLVGEIE